MDIKSILAAAKDTAKDGDLSSSNFDNSWRPAPNNYRVQVVRTNHGKTTKGDPRIGLWLEITEGPDSGKRWWDNITLFENNPGAAAINFGKLLAMGVDERTIAALNDVAAIAPLLDGWSGPVRVEHKANSGKPDDPYINTYFVEEGQGAQTETLDEVLPTDDNLKPDGTPYRSF